MNKEKLIYILKDILEADPDMVDLAMIIVLTTISPCDWWEYFGILPFTTSSPVGTIYVKNGMDYYRIFFTLPFYHIKPHDENWHPDIKRIFI